MAIQSQNYQKLTDNLKNISNFINNGAGSSRSTGGGRDKAISLENEGPMVVPGVKSGNELFRIRQDHDNLIGEEGALISSRDRGRLTAADQRASPAHRHDGRGDQGGRLPR